MRPRRFIRTRKGRLVGGVSSGLGSYFGVDPLLFRIGFVAASFFGGVGLFVYLAFLLFVPEEDASRAPIRALGRSWATIAGGVILLVAGGIAIDAIVHSVDHDAGPLGGLGFLALAGLGAAAVGWRLRRREGEDRESPDRRMWRYLAFGGALCALAGVLFAAGGYLAGTEGEIAGWAVVLVGGGLVAATLMGRTRWLIVPAVAFALPVTLVTAADADLRGGVGDRTHRPESIAQVRDSYRLGVGRLELDLREVDFPAGDTPLRVKVGVGEIVLFVPKDVCVALDSDVGGGYVGALDREHGGLDEEWSNRAATPPPGTPRLVVEGEVGLGTLFVAERPFDNEHRRTFQPGEFGDNDACRQGTGTEDR